MDTKRKEPIIFYGYLPIGRAVSHSRVYFPQEKMTVDAQKQFWLLKLDLKQ
jgi:hypothetical protein